MNGETEWEKKRNAEQRIAEDTKYKPAEKKFRAVLAALGFVEMKWPDGDRIRWRDSVDMRAVKGDLTIHLYAYGYKLKNRYSIGGSLPRAKPPAETSTYDLPPIPNITMADSKTAEDMVKEIQRRFLPGYMVAVEEARKRNAQAEGYADGRTKTLRALLTAAGEKMPTEDGIRDGKEYRDGRGRFDRLPGNVWGSFQAFDDRVNLELHGVPVETAVEVVKLLRSVKETAVGGIGE